MESYQTIIIVLCTVGILLGLIPSLAIGFAQIPTQEDLDKAAAAGVTIEEMQKAEKSVNRVADMMREVATMNDNCLLDLQMEDYSTLKPCINFVFTLEKHLQQILNESQADISKIRGY